MRCAIRLGGPYLQRDGPSSVQRLNGADMRGTVGALWGISGVLLILGGAVYRLAPLAAEAFSFSLAWYHQAILVTFISFMAYAEGFIGFQKRFSPRVAARARYLAAHPRPLFLVFAPFFCMGYFHATPRRRYASLLLTAGIICLVLMVRLLPQPWRGIIDAGVVVGLLWGVLSLVLFSVKAFTVSDFPYAPEVPEREGSFTPR